MEIEKSCNNCGSVYIMTNGCVVFSQCCEKYNWVHWKPMSEPLPSDRKVGQPVIVDQINPDHYKHNGIECIDAIQASMTDEAFVGFLKGNVMKYLWRLGRKGEKDHEKAKWYQDRLVDFLNDKK